MPYPVSSTILGNTSSLSRRLRTQLPTHFQDGEILLASSVYNRAHSMIAKRGRLYEIERVLLRGIPRNAVLEDVERFLSGSEYDSTSIQIIFRPASQENMAIVHFPSDIEEMNCFITKNRGFCLNSQISVRVL